MRRNLLVIPKEQVEFQFLKNSRQDIKIVVPAILTDELFTKLKDKKKGMKREQHLGGHIWSHSKCEERNYICESKDFVNGCLGGYYHGPLAIYSTNERAPQEGHYHQYHFELYCSEHKIIAEYRNRQEPRCECIEIKGGIIVFGPEVVHKVTLEGMTYIIAIPCVTKDGIEEDKVIEEP